MAKGTIPLTSANGSWEGRIHWVSASEGGGTRFLVEAMVLIQGKENIQASEMTPFYGRLVIGTEEEQITFPRVRDRLTYVGFLRVQVKAEGPNQVQIRAGFSAPSGTAIGTARLEGGETETLTGDDSPRPSEVLLGDSSVRMGETLEITFLKDHPSCIHELSYRFENHEQRIGTVHEACYGWQVPDLSYYCGIYGVCFLRCSTYLHGRYLGFRETSLTIRVPDPVVPRSEELELGKEGEIQAHRPVGNFYLNLRVRMGEQEYDVGEGWKNTFLWTPPYEPAALWPDRTVLPGTLICETRNGDHLVGRRECDITLRVPENQETKPRIQGLELTPVSQKIPESFGFIRGKTGLKAGFTVQSPYSEVTSWEISTGRSRASGNPSVIPLLEEGGQVEVRAKVKDRRGFTGIFTQNIFVVPYEKPRLLPYPGEKTLICGRSQGDGTLSPQGKSLKLKLSVEGTEIAPQGVNLNPCSLSLRLKEGEGAFGEPVSLLKPGAETLDRILKTGKLSLLHSYQAELTAEDALGEKTLVTIPILSQAVSFGLYDGPDGAAFGKYPESPQVVDLAPQMTLLVRGKLDLRGEQWQPLSLAAGVDPSLSPHGSAEGVQLRLHGGNQVILCFSCAWPGAGKVINREPVPAALRPGAPVSAVCPSEGGLTLATLETDGLIRLSPLFGKEAPAWIQGNITYFT